MTSPQSSSSPGHNSEPFGSYDALIWSPRDPGAKRSLNYRPEYVVVRLGPMMPLNSLSPRWQRILATLMVLPVFMIFAAIVCALAALATAREGEPWRAGRDNGL